jgi:hypothetical protein
VEPFPPTGEKHQAPKAVVDYHPVWAPDGRSIFYIPTGPGFTMSVLVTTQAGARQDASVVFCCISELNDRQTGNASEVARIDRQHGVAEDDRKH